MYFAQSPHEVSRSTVPAPVNGPKNTVPVSTTTGAARTIVGVPTLPIIASTALGPRMRRVSEIAGATGGFIVVGQCGDSPVITWASTSARAAASAVAGS